MGLALLSITFVVRAALSPLRRLSFDEAYYLCAERRHWPIHDHPPLLGALLALVERLAPGPIELRVRLLAAALQVLTALGIARLARTLALREHAHLQGRAWWWGLVLGTVGLLPMASGLLTTPDAPLLAAMAWLVALCAEERPEHDLSLFALAVFAVLSKVVAIPLLLALIAGALSAGSLRRAALLTAGLVVPIPLWWPSFHFQLSHVLGHGPAASAPRVGPVLALLALLLGQLLLHSPPVVVYALRAHATLRGSRGLRLSSAVLLALVCASALASGRPPEPNWLAPAALPFLAVAAVVLAGTAPTRARWVLLVYVAPAVVALGAWASPLDRGPFARVPHALPTGAVSNADLPPYALASWRCIYQGDCEQIDAIFMTSSSRMNR